MGYNATYEQLTTGQPDFSAACIRDNKWEYYRGSACAALMMYHGWEITDDYPWK